MVEQASGVAPDSEPSGPDPIYGLALIVVGILTMGVAGAATLHYVFNAGTALTILGSKYLPSDRRLKAEGKSV